MYENRHHFTSLKTVLIFLQPGALEQNFHEFLNHIKSYSFTTSRELQHQFAACSG